MQDDVRELIALERRRCHAISIGDVETLRTILAGDYVHVHANGKIDDLVGHLEAIRRRPRKPSPGDLLVRCYGNAAVVIGEQENQGALPDQALIAQQVAARSSDGRWRFVSMMLVQKRGP
ncbi:MULTISPECIES: nuclear transport factor 2 family protein [unclassified Bradyrhizobium]|uniref:nuclear transport factor 2 family protein n=1 Tax=unclassified Bradyrhizobium TaxID=2631580 RepID=UPI00291693E3|nr:MULTISPECIES: nuclear transport factor 2 family protein [unclassified Bradyrhizobium]